LFNLLERLITLLPSAIDAQLQRDADLSMVEYMTLAMLSEAPEGTLRMSDLAERASSASASTHPHVDQGHRTSVDGCRPSLNCRFKLI